MSKKSNGLSCRKKAARVLGWFPGFPLSLRWDAVQPLPQRYTLKPSQDTFDHLLSLWLPSATRIAPQHDSTAWLMSFLGCL